MRQHQEVFRFATNCRGIYEISDEVGLVVERSGLVMGLCTVYCMHTSASLVIQENADPSARADLEGALDRLVPEDDPHYTHTLEGPDDMPSHTKAALTHTSESIPVVAGRLVLGTWQGIYLWEQRTASHQRRVTITVH